MECQYCRGNLVRSQASYAVSRKGYHLIMDDLPAWVCEQCGEPLFSEEAVDVIQEMLHEVDARMETLVASQAAD